MICSEINSFEQSEVSSITDFAQQLRDTVDKVHLTSEFVITHPDYEPLEVPVYHREHLTQVAAQDRDRYLTGKLKIYLYSIYSGVTQLKHNAATKAKKAENSDQKQPMANYVDKWSRTKFYQRITQNNHGQGYQDPDWLVVKQENANHWQITKDGLTLKIQPDQNSEQLQVGQLVSIKMPPNLVDHGTYIAVGDAGHPVRSGDAQAVTVIQIYFNVGAETTLLLLERLTQQLNHLKIPFNFRIAYEESDYDRLDAAVLEIRKENFEQLKPILQAIYQENQEHFQPAIPFFCKPLASGLGLAEKPQSPDYEPSNIGQHYCGVIAQALLAAWSQEKSGTDKLDYVLNHLAQMGIKVEHIYLNPDSADIYQTIQ
ncbi:MAG: T3SS effector HopA1 family protein [Waterburya sp.]